MAGTVQPIRADVTVQDDSKQSLMDYLAQSHDELAAKTGKEVAAVVFCFIDVDGGVRPGYYTRNVVSERNSLYIARGAHSIMSRAEDWA